MIVATLMLLAAQSTAPEAPTLNASELDQWRAHLVPADADLRYARIDWAPTFQDGVERASSEGKPLLLWLMNGHPLGCT